MNILIDYKTIKKIGLLLKKEIMREDKGAGSFRMALKRGIADEHLKNKYKGGFSLEEVKMLQCIRYCKELVENGKALEVYNKYCKYNL